MLCVIVVLGAEDVQTAICPKPYPVPMMKAPLLAAVQSLSSGLCARCAARRCESWGCAGDWVHPALIGVRAIGRLLALCNIMWLSSTGSACPVFHGPPPPPPSAAASAAPPSPYVGEMYSQYLTFSQLHRPLLDLVVDAECSSV